MQKYLDKFARLPNSVKLIMLAGLIVVTIGFYLLGPIKSTTDRIDALTSEQNSLLEERERKRVIANDLEKFQRLVADLESQLTRAKQELPNQQEIPELLRQVDNLGRTIGLTWVTWQMQDEQPQEFYAKIPVEIEVTGGFHDVARFFAKVGNLKRIVNIENIEMGTPTERNGKVLLAVKGLAVTFRFMEEAPPVDPNAAPQN